MAQNDTAKSGNGGSLGCEADLFKAADKLRGNMAPSDHKHVALQVAGTLPPGATWDDVRYQIELRASVEHGLADSRAGRLIPVEELLREFGLAE